MNFTKQESRKRRHYRVRNKISGTPSRPRLNVKKSNTNFYAQIIDDTTGKTLVAASSLKLTLKNKSNIAAAVAVADDLAKKAKAAKIDEVVFDRGGYLYHGKVKAFAEEMRKQGIKF